MKVYILSTLRKNFSKENFLNNGAEYSIEEFEELVNKGEFEAQIYRIMFI